MRIGRIGTFTPSQTVSAIQKQEPVAAPAPVERAGRGAYLAETSTLTAAVTRTTAAPAKPSPFNADFHRNAFQAANAVDHGNGNAYGREKHASTTSFGGFLSSTPQAPTAPTADASVAFAPPETAGGAGGGGHLKSARVQGRQQNDVAQARFNRYMETAPELKQALTTQTRSGLISKLSQSALKAEANVADPQPPPPPTQTATQPTRTATQPTQTATQPVVQTATTPEPKPAVQTATTPEPKPAVQTVTTSEPKPATPTVTTSQPKPATQTATTSTQTQAASTQTTTTSTPTTTTQRAPLASSPTQVAPSTAAPAADDDTAIRQAMARDIADHQSYYYGSDGSHRALSTTQKDALTKQLSSFSVDNLEDVKDNNIQYAVVDPYHTPSEIQWNMNNAAFYDPKRDTVYLSQYRMDHTIIHETGHALDDIHSAGTSEWSSTGNDELQDAFSAYKSRISQDPSKDWDSQYNAYAATNILEFTAEASRMYLESDATRNKLQTLDPQTFHAIGEFLAQAS